MKKLFIFAVISTAIFSTQVIAKKPAERKHSEYQNVTESKRALRGEVKTAPEDHGSGFLTPEKPHTIKK